MKHILTKRIISICTVIWLFFESLGSYAQQAYYIDGYHGGIWGHYPDWNTRFMVDMLNKHPYWKINLEIEPETWEHAAKVDPQALDVFKAMMTDQSINGRLEYVNPAYAQSYMYNIDGESIIRQFSYGIKKLKATFPGIKFSTYSSEEPCFTNSLPGILRSFGFKYASLKNPNTCFGGYAKAFGGELVNWIGPDGSSITTAPRYAIEKLEPKSTWQTIGWINSPDYLNAAFKYGIKHPIGMTLQDAGWKNGPFLDQSNTANQKQYTTWRRYFEQVAKGEKVTDWKVSQEDILVSLVWGSQVTQQIAQRVRAAENKILQAEKLSAIVSILNNKTRAANFDNAWRTLLLAQHHDCWIVPYNGDNGDTWADRVQTWTTNTVNQSDSIVKASVGKINPSENIITVYNTQAKSRRQAVKVAIPKGVIVMDAKGNAVPIQISGDSVLFVAEAPSFGYSIYKFQKGSSASVKGVKVIQLAEGKHKLESNLYSIIIDANKGGSIVSWYDKRNKWELIDINNANGFNSLRGNFYEDGGFKTTKDQLAEVSVIEKGPVRATILLTTSIAGTSVHQRISLTNDDPVVDMQVNIDWKRNVRVGEYVDKSTYKWTDYKKPFYNDSNKLLMVFPLALKGQKIYKNAPFEVTTSKLKNTFFDSWDRIKNNVILNWVDVMAGDRSYGIALFTDHTTSYTHGNNFPPGLVVQYSGMGLWGRDYFTDGQTAIHYALLPHKGNWNSAGVWSASAAWNEPFIASVAAQPSQPLSKSLIDIRKTGLAVTSVTTDRNDLFVRFFNAEGVSGNKTIILNFPFDKIQLVELDGRISGIVKVKKLADGGSQVQFAIPKFGIRTLQLSR